MRQDDPGAVGLSVRELECTRGGRKVFAGLGFELKAGEAIEVRGANGSGKSSLLRLLCGLLPPSRGEVRWRDRPVRAGDAHYAQELSYLGHASGMNADLTALENLQFSLHVAGSARAASACREVLARLGLERRENDSARHLSQGQRQRLVLARVLLSARPLWLLDEPCAGLDADAERLFGEFLRDHLAQGGLAVVTTHRGLGDTSRATQFLDMDGLSHAGSVESHHRS